MGIPQVIWIVLVSLSLGIIAKEHGEMREQNFLYSLISILIQVGLLWWGGFFG
jgi:uncharacterized membrane protein YbjE (DUF340 family)